MATDTLTAEELKLSREASKQLGFRVILFQDGHWICDPVAKAQKMGFGTTPAEAVENCRTENNQA